MVDHYVVNVIVHHRNADNTVRRSPTVLRTNPYADANIAKNYVVSSNEKHCSSWHLRARKEDAATRSSLPGNGDIWIRNGYLAEQLDGTAYAEDYRTRTTTTDTVAKTVRPAVIEIRHFTDRPAAPTNRACATALGTRKCSHRTAEWSEIWRGHRR